MGRVLQSKLFHKNSYYKKKSKPASFPVSCFLPFLVNSPFHMSSLHEATHHVVIQPEGPHQNQLDVGAMASDVLNCELDKSLFLYKLPIFSYFNIATENRPKRYLYFLRARVLVCVSRSTFVCGVILSIHNL